MASQIQPALLRKMTVRRILDVLQNHGPASRADLMRHSGISAPTVSKVVATLLESGLLEEGDAPEASLGRPGKLLRLATESAQVIGVVLDAKHCIIAAAGLDGMLHEKRSGRIATPGSYKLLIDEIVRHVQPLVEAEGVNTLGLGISTPGLINRRTQTVALSPNLHITNGRSPARDLAEQLGLETVMLHETHALCLAERMTSGEKEDDFAMLDVSTGLGLGVFSGGKLLEGNSGMAGELGHITIDPRGKLCGCGNHGCLETLATDTALANLISERLGRQVDIEEAVDMIHSGKIQAADELNRTCEYLSIAMAAVVNLFNPATLFVHGRFLDAQDGLFQQVVDLTRRRALRPSVDDCRIVQARGSKRLGAVAGIIHHLTDSLGPSLS